MQNSLAKFPKPELCICFLDVENILPLLYTVLLLLQFSIETSKFDNRLFFPQVIISVMNQQDLLPYLQELVSEKMKIH